MVPARPLILIGILLLVVAVPLSQDAWGGELPWIKMIAAIAGPATVFYLYWYYWRESADPDRARFRRRVLVLIGAPLAAGLGALLAGADGVANVLAVVAVGLAGGCLYYFFSA